MVKKMITTFRRMWFVLEKKQKRYGVFVIVLSIGGALFETLGVSIIVPLIQTILDPMDLLRSIGIDKVAYTIGIDSTTKILIAVVGLVIFIYLFKNIYLTMLAYIRSKFSCKIQQELSVRMLKSYVDKGYSFFLQNNTADFLRGVDKSITGFYLVLSQLLRLLVEVLTIICICLYVTMTDAVLAICVIGLAILCLIVILSIYRKRMKINGEKYFTYSGKVNKVLLETIQGIKEILVMHKQDFFLKEYEDSYRMLQKTVVKRNMAQESPAYIIESICITGLIGCVCIKVGMMPNPQDYIPKLGAFAVAAFRVLPSLGRISSGFNICMYYIPCVEDVYENIKAINREKSNNIEKDELRTTISFKDEIVCNNLKYRYIDGKDYVIDDLSLKIRKGQSIAIIGKSGAGKTTLADIILGLLEPQAGEVQVDGINISKNLYAWEKIIGFVPQNVYLLDDTIRNNVAFGIEKEKIDDAQVWDAIRQAQLEEMVNEMSDKLDTFIGDRGVKISGGQRQRLAIARVLYRNPEILVLDEATSALDEETEQAIIESIEYLKRKKTLIIIAHRLTTIRTCDAIYEIIDGKAVSRTYEEVFS